MSIREIPGAIHENETRNKILDTATKLFSIKGFATVSVRDIAETVNIKASSIYNHYKSKEEILDDILRRFEKGYRNYMDNLCFMNSKAKTLDEIVDNFFNKEFIEMHDNIGCLGMALVVKEQHNNEHAKKCTFELLHKLSIDSLESCLDYHIQNGTIPPSDTKTIATFFMHSVLTMNDVRIHEYMNVPTPTVDRIEVWDNFKRFITKLLAAGS